MAAILSQKIIRKRQKTAAFLSLERSKKEQAFLSLERLVAGATG